MRKYFIAVTRENHEYYFRKNTACYVSIKNKEKIVEFLNANKYMLTQDEKWHIYENDRYYDSLIFHEIKPYKNTLRLYKLLRAN